ncbi:MAG: ATPase/DNA packaging protein, partial [bacterium]
LLDKDRRILVFHDNSTYSQALGVNICQTFKDKQKCHRLNISHYNHKKMKEFLTDYHNPSFNSHQIKVPFRIGVIGSSGGGKSQWLLNMLSKMQDTFGHIYVCYRAPEPLYQFLA